MKSQAHFQFEGLVDGYLQLTVIDDGFKHLIKVTPRKMLGIVAQLAQVDDNTSTVSMPVNGVTMPFIISRSEAHQLVSEIAALMKWKR